MKEGMHFSRPGYDIRLTLSPMSIWIDAENQEEATISLFEIIEKIRTLCSTYSRDGFEIKIEKFEQYNATL